MADAIGSVRATFTASAGGMIGAVDQIVGKLGSFAAAAKRTQAQTGEYQKVVSGLADQFARGDLTADQYAEKVGRVQGKFKGIGEAERMRVATAALAAAQAEAGDYAGVYDSAIERVTVSVRAATPPMEQLTQRLAATRAAVIAGTIAENEHAAAIRADVAAINGEETAQARAERIFKQSQETIRKNATATDIYDQEIRQLTEQLEFGAISQADFDKAAKRAKETLDKSEPSAKSLGDAFGGLPGPLGAAARAFDTMQKSLGGTIAGFKSGGISGGISSFVEQLRSGIANAGSTGGASLVGIAPQIGLIAGAGYAAVQGVNVLASALGEVGSRVERTSQLSDRLGISFQQYEILATAANRAGVETEALASAQTKGLKAISAARDGAGEEAKAFEALGISQEQLNTTNPAALLELAAQKLDGIQDPATRAALAVKIFGKSGNDVLPALKGIDSVREGIQRLGGVMNDADKMRFTALDDAFDNAGRASTRLGEVLLTPFTGLFQTVTEGIAATFGGFASALAPVAPLVDNILKPFGMIIQVIGEGIGLIGRFIGATVSGVGQMIAGIAEIVSYSEVLGPVFDGIGMLATGIYDSFTAIGKEIFSWIQWFEKITGVEIAPMKAGSDAEAIEAQAKAQEEAKKTEEELKKKAEERAKTIKDGLLSPYEKMQRSVAELNDLEQRGLLTAEERAAEEAKLRDAFAAQDPIAQQAKKTAEEQKKAAEDITKQIEASVKAGKDLGAAADPIRSAFQSTADALKSQVEQGLISPEEARSQMATAVDEMNAELQRLGEDQKFAEKIREGFKSEADKIKEELAAIDASQTLTADEKEKAKGQVRDKFTAGLPGAAEKDAADKFRDDQAKLKEAFDKGLINKDEFRARQGRLREEMDGSVADLKDKQEKNKQPDRRAVGAVDVNSSEGASTFFRLLRGQDDPTKKQLDEMKRQTRLLEKVASAESEVVQI